MIARLKGILEENAKERVVVDVQGVGYGLFVPETVLRRLPAVGQAVTLEVYTHVREDQLTLFGFLSTLEREVFELLMSASGVGPKLALTILSALDAKQILEGVSRADKALFSGISGVGKKTVEKIFVEIREKAEKKLLQERGVGAQKTSKLFSPMENSWSEDLLQALVALGYRENDVISTVREVAAHGEIKEFDSALRHALQMLSRAPKGLRGNV